MRSPVAYSFSAVIAAIFLGAVCWVGLRDPRAAGLLAASARLAAASCAIALPLGLVLALAIVKTNVRGRRAAAIVLLSLVFLPLYLQAAAWDAGFGLQGWYTLVTNPRLASVPLLDGWRGAIWVHAMAAVPWVVLIVGAHLSTVERELEESALLVAPAWRVVCCVTLRRAAGAIVVAAIWIALLSFSEIAATDIFQVRTFAEEVYTQAALGGLDFPLAATPGESNVSPGQPLQSAGLLTGLLLIVAVATLMLKLGWHLAGNGGRTTTRGPWRMRLGGSRWPMTALLWSLMLVVAGVPLANLVYKAGVEVRATESGRERGFSATKVVTQVALAPWEHRRELINSLRIGSLAATAALLLAIPFAWSLRGRPRLIDLRLGVLACWLAVPGPILGLAVIRILNQPADSSWAWLTWLYDDPIFAPWLVQTVRAWPMAVLVLWPALATVSQATVDAARSEGASWWQRFARVVLPQRVEALIAAWLVALTVAFSELAATKIVMPPGPDTIAVKIFRLVHYGVEDQVAAICLVMIATVVFPTAVVAWWYHRRVKKRRV